MHYAATGSWLQREDYANVKVWIKRFRIHCAREDAFITVVHYLYFRGIKELNAVRYATPEELLDTLAPEQQNKDQHNLFFKIWKSLGTNMKKEKKSLAYLLEILISKLEYSSFYRILPHQLYFETWLQQKVRPKTLMKASASLKTENIPVPILSVELYRPEK